MHRVTAPSLRGADVKKGVVTLGIDQNEMWVNRRRAPRFHVRCEGELLLGDSKVKILVKNVSSSGLSALVDQMNKVEFGKLICACITVGETAESDLEISAVWKDDEGNFGFKIEKADENWNQFIKGLFAK